MKLSIALLALTTLPLAACDESLLTPGTEEAQPEVPAKPRPPAVSPLVVPIETNASQTVPAINADAETLNTAAFAARGNEPYWSIEVSENTAVYSTAPDQRGRKITVNRLFFAEGVEYVGTLDGLVFVANFRGVDCTDSLTGEKYPMTASVTVRRKTLHGCAVPAIPAGAGK